MHTPVAVDPHLLDAGVVEERLQHPEPAHRGEHVPHTRRLVLDESAAAGERPVIVPSHLSASECPGAVGIRRGVHALGAQTAPHEAGDGRGGLIHPRILATITRPPAKLSTPVPRRTARVNRFAAPDSAP